MSNPSDASSATDPSPLRNVLHLETSPYLLQHKDNPVHWQPWGPEVLKKAKDSGKPIMLSVGYAACHWCHVMAHESFEDEPTAALMNELFINVKVDREERPDIDTIYQSALAVLGEHGGWPLTMFLAPNGEPFWGGTYFPPEDRYGRPGFKNVLKKVVEVYRANPEAVEQNQQAIVGALHRLSEVRGDQAPPLSPALLNDIAQRLAKEVDGVYGGIGGAPKFPQTGILELLWRAYQRTGDSGLRDHVVLTLNCMCQGGIYDHLGGGFARYATDERWLVPHFEKMLYDNAQMIDCLTLVWQATESPLYQARVKETVDWVLREMTAEGGGFAASLDADSEGKEGKFYVWSEQEIDGLLGDDSGTFKTIYDVTPAGNWEETNILNRSRRPIPDDAVPEATLAELREILLQARAKRTRPGWDDKVLADWNGLMIVALANAGAVFGEPAWIEAARRAFSFVQGSMMTGGRLHHAARAGQARHAALLDDYANLCRAALSLLEVTGDAAYLDQAEDWIEVLDRHYWNDNGGGYFYTANDAEALIARTRNATDHAVPSGNGTILGVLNHLYRLTGNDHYDNRASALSDAFSPELGRNFFPLSTFLNSLDTHMRGLQVVVVGSRDEATTQAMMAAVRETSLPGRLLTVVPPDATLPPNHPAAGKTQTQGQVTGLATAYVCRGTTCSLPVTDIADLKTLLNPGS